MVVEPSPSLGSLERGLRLCRGLHTVSSRPVRIFGATHDVSDTGTSYIDGMTSSGPDIDELDVASDSGAAACLSCSGSDSGCGAAVFGTSALLSIFEATTQESPRVALSLGGGLSGMFMLCCCWCRVVSTRVAGSCDSVEQSRRAQSINAGNRSVIIVGV